MSSSIITTSSTTTATLVGKVLCFTGTLQSQTRAQATKAAMDAGAAKVSKTITNSVNIVILGNGAGAKKQQAENKGCEIWTEQEFLEALKNTNSDDDDVVAMDEDDDNKKETSTTTTATPAAAAAASTTKTKGRRRQLIEKEKLPVEIKLRSNSPVDMESFSKQVPAGWSRGGGGVDNDGQEEEVATGVVAVNTGPTSSEQDPTVLGRKKKKRSSPQTKTTMDDDEDEPSGKKLKATATTTTITNNSAAAAATTTTTMSTPPPAKTKAPPAAGAAAAAAAVPLDDDVVAAGTLAGTVDKAASSNLQTNGTVYKDYDVMLNQTNVGANNNKFYKIQLIQSPGGRFTLFTRWGRVGETGQSKEFGPWDDIEYAKKEFGKKFKNKTGNPWFAYQQNKKSFKSKSNKYTVVEMEKDVVAASAMAKAAAASSSSSSAKKNKPVVAPCQLDPTTKQLVDLIFDQDTFKSAMTAMNLDLSKLPLGALSQSQIAKGYDVLERLQAAISSPSPPSYGLVQSITSEFYTVIPHAFGRQRPPILNTTEQVQQKLEMLNVLSDIEVAQTMVTTPEETTTTHQPHPSDAAYNKLAADLTLLDPSSTKEDCDEYKLIETYFDDTRGGPMKLRKVWRVNRHEEDQRFAKHSDIEERKLLWHGTNVAVVAAILKSGLRIMPHSGGRVGRGIYLADQHQKSAQYTRGARGTIIMFLVEAALGKAHEIKKDDSSLTTAPAGFDSVLAKGRKEPPNKKEMEIDGKLVTIPQGKPSDVAEAADSYFYHNEFLIYQESQHRIRYVLSFDSH